MQHATHRITVMFCPPLFSCLQVGLHEQYGGVKPDVARDAHAAAIHSTVDEAIREAGIQPQQLSAVAVTIGPGLSLCLQVRCFAWVCYMLDLAS
jgi:tRNA A37 threonylcarbamoyltransferase TsaD